MDFKMNDLNQLIIKFEYEQNFKDDDFYVSKSNKNTFDMIKNGHHKKGDVLAIARIAAIMSVKKNS